MQVAATDFDDHSLGMVDLMRSADGRATVDGQVVLAMRPIGSRVALIAGGRQYCVSTADYWRVMGAADRTGAGDQTGLGHMTFVISGKKFPPMWLRSKARYSEVIPNVRFNRAV